MKKFSFILSILSLFIGGNCYAQSFTVDGISYEPSSSKPGCVYIVRSGMGYQMEHIVIPSNVSNNGTSYKVVGIYNGAIQGSRKLVTVELPNTIEEIGFNAFSMCKSLKSINLPSSIKSIGQEAFFCCEALEEITIPESIKEIGKGAFKQCKSLKDVSIPNSITEIPSELFYSCDMLTKVVLPSTVTSIGSSAFSSCPLEEISLPAALTVIEKDAFKGCQELKSVVVPNKVHTIGDRCFNNCKNLTSIQFPNSLKKIGASAIAECVSLTEVTIPASVTEIKSLFFGCTNLTSITLASMALKSVTSGSFDKCPALKSVRIMTAKPPLMKLDVRYTYNSSAGNLIMYVPKGTATTYKAAKEWSEYTFEEM